MAKQSKALKKPANTGGKMLRTVTDQLNSSLTSLKVELGEKKFEKRIKKAAKKLVAGIEKKSTKNSPAKPKKVAPVKKKAAKTPTKKAKKIIAK